METCNRVIQNKLKGKKIILASGSPRRSELLGELGIEFTMAKIEGYDESYPNDIPTGEIAEYICREKSLHYSKELTENEILITSDTIVVLGDEIMGKPASKEEAVKMLRELSGKSHEVITAVCLRDCNHTVSFSDSTKVTFYPLSDSEIEYYVDNYKPYDKAGSYAIQEWIGLSGVESIEGSVYTVIGLPVARLYRELLSF